MVYSDFKELFIDAKNIATGANDLHLKSILLDIQGKVFELQEENRNLRNDFHDLKNIKILETELVYHEGVYLKESDVYCSVCWDEHKRLARVRKFGKITTGNTLFYCDVCKYKRSSNIPYL